MSPDRRNRMAGASAVLALSASAAFARAPDLPAELRERVAIEIERCSPVGRGDALLEARVRIRASGAAIDLPGIHCGAFDDEGAPLFLAPVTGRVRLAAHGSEQLTVRFAADSAHRECGCTVRTGAPVDAEFDRLVAALSAEDSQSEGEGATGGELAPSVAAPPALRYERVLARDLSLRAEPSSRAPITGRVPVSARIAVDRARGGWKLARTSDGLSGWLPSDASTADLAAPERVSEQLAPLHAALALKAASSEPLCGSVPRDSLGDLVAMWRLEERAVYVRPLWHALDGPDQSAFRTWAAECHAATRVLDAMSGLELGNEPAEPR